MTPRTRLIILNSPANPTGGVVPRAEIDRLVKGLERFPNVAGTGFDAKGLQMRLLDEAGVATIAGTSFGAFGEGYLRFSYASSLPQLAEAVERIRRFLGNAPPRAASGQ